ncbi:MAG TPA: DNA repair protein RecO [Bacillota bacterium]
MSLVQTEGIVLRSRPFGEADKVLTILSKEHGKLEAVAKGARRPRSRLVGAAQPFSYLKILLFTGRSLDQLSQAEIVKSFSTLRDDLTKMAYASYWSELADSFLPWREPNPELFLFFLAGLVVLERAEDPVLISRAFELRLLSYLGYLPTLDTCARCGVPLETGEKKAVGAGFSPEEGGLICDRCLPELLMNPVSLSAQEILIMKNLLTTDLRRVSQLKISPDTIKELGRALRLFIEYQADKPLKSLLFLESLEG